VADPQPRKHGANRARRVTDAYKHFDAREEGWTKVVLHPGQTA
jgi:hypothetical protein